MLQRMQDKLIFLTYIGIQLTSWEEEKTAKWNMTREQIVRTLIHATDSGETSIGIKTSSICAKEYSLLSVLTIEWEQDQPLQKIWSSLKGTICMLWHLQQPTSHPYKNHPIHQSVAVTPICAPKRCLAPSKFPISISPLSQTWETMYFSY